MEKEKTLTNVPGFEDKPIVIKRMNFGEKSKLSSKTTAIRVINGQESIDIDPEASRLYTLVYGIKSAPFITMADETVKLRAISQLEEDTGVFLLEEIKKINSSQIEKEIVKK